MLESMSAYDRTKLADALRTEEYQEGEYIVRQGEPGDIFYLIEEGSAVAMKIFEGKTEAQEVETYKVRLWFIRYPVESLDLEFVATFPA